MFGCCCYCLQGPLASLDLSVHVLYRITRARLAANFLAFSTTAAENELHRAELRHRLDLLRQDYSTLMYGGKMLLAVRGIVSKPRNTADHLNRVSHHRMQN